MAGDIKLLSKTNNFGDGNLDFEVKGQNFDMVIKNKLIEQALLKGTIASYDDELNYGADVRSLAGLKFHEILQTIVIDKILYLCAFIEHFYDLKVGIKTINTEFVEKGHFRIHVDIGQESFLEV